MAWLLNFAYFLLCLAIAPVLLYRRVVQGKYRDGWSQKLLGRLPRRDSDRPCLWLHAVSVGEVLQLQTIVKELLAARPGLELVITTTTSTGLGVAREKFPQHTVCYFPLDFSWAVQSAIARIQPTAIVLVELELWPNFITAAHKAHVPLALINGRISEKSFRGYRRIGWLMRRLLPRFAFLAAQNETYAARLRELGAPMERLHVTGSIKFDHVQADRRNPRTLELREHFHIEAGTPVFVAGSTQEPEEEIAIRAWQRLRSEIPELRLIVVPRHKERFEAVAETIRRHNLVPLRRSQPRPEEADPANSIGLLDTLGELAACWGLADIAFVGGSLTRRGGQNMIEPAGYGAAVCFGPNTWNFRDVVENLKSGDAAKVVRSEDELYTALRQWLRDPADRLATGQRAQRLVMQQQGATARTIRLIDSFFSDKTNASAQRDRRAA